MNIALIQLASWGDNINSTLMFLPIKQSYPQSRLDVYTTTKYASAFTNCPGVDGVFAAHAATKEAAFDLYNTIPAKVAKSGQYQMILNPAPVLHPGEWNSLKHPELGTNLIYSFVRELERHNIDYKLPLQTLMVLLPEELKKARDYMASRPQGRRNILMEVHGESGQTFWSPHWTIEVGKYLLEKPTNLFISRAGNSGDIVTLQQFASRLPNSSVEWVGHLTIRECAEVFNHCDAFFSVSSGLSNAVNTYYCKKDIKWVEAVNSETVNSAPIRSTGKNFWYKNDLLGYLKMLRTIGL